MKESIVWRENSVGLKFKDKLISWVADIRLYTGGIVFFGASSYQVKGPDMRNILNILHPGDVLLRRYDHYFGSIFIPGYWSHAALYEGDNQVLHMLGHGMTREDILTFMRTDHIAILRCEDEEKVKDAIERAQKLFDAHTEYDYEFETDDDQLYCSELIWFVFDKPKEITYKKWILPDDLDCSFFSKIWHNRR
jgi:hypothetical protein